MSTTLQVFRGKYKSSFISICSYIYISHLQYFVRLMEPHNTEKRIAIISQRGTAIILLMLVYSLQMQYREEEHPLKTSSEALWKSLDRGVKVIIEKYLKTWIKYTPVLITWFMENQHWLTDNGLRLLLVIDRQADLLGLEKSLMLL